jgi:hypothetical protein
MTKEELAQLLHGKHYGEEIPDDLIESAKKSNLVIVYGASDDLMEFEGAITDEVGCYDGGDCLIDNDGLLDNREDIEDDDDLEDWFRRKKQAKKLEAIWNPNGFPTWSYRTSIPHATFDVVEDADVYCRGIVFKLDEL